MERIGDASPYDPSHHMDWAYWACKGAPATIRPGAVVRMATALERVANLNEDAGDIGDGMLRTIVADAKDALAAYYGENGND